MTVIILRVLLWWGNVHCALFRHSRYLTKIIHYFMIRVIPEADDYLTDYLKADMTPEEFKRSINGNTAATIIRVEDGELIAEWASREFSKLFGVDIKGCNEKLRTLDLYHWGYDRQFRCEIESVLAGEDGQIHEAVYHIKTTRHYDGIIATWRRKYMIGDKVYIFVTFRDITAHRKTQQRLSQIVT